MTSMQARSVGWGLIIRESGFGECIAMNAIGTRYTDLTFCDLRLLLSSIFQDIWITREKQFVRRWKMEQHGFMIFFKSSLLGLI